MCLPAPFCASSQPIFCGTQRRNCCTSAQVRLSRHASVMTCTKRLLPAGDGTQVNMDRRTVLSASLALPLLHLASPEEVCALPLAPLGRGSDTVGGPKLQQPALKELQDILARDLAEGQYFVTGNLTPEAFADDCRFVDPTNDVTGLSKYKKALTILFDPAQSEVQFKGIRISGPDTIEADWTLGGTLKLPWRPRIQTIDGHTVYSINSKGLVQKQEQQWSISAFEALRQTFTPAFGK